MVYLLYINNYYLDILARAFNTVFYRSGSWHEGLLCIRSLAALKCKRLPLMTLPLSLTPSVSSSQVQTASSDGLAIFSNSHSLKMFLMSSTTRYDWFSWEPSSHHLAVKIPTTFLHLSPSEHQEARV